MTALSERRGIVLCGSLLAASLTAAIAFGSAELGPRAALLALADRSREGARLIWDLRLPRVLAGALIGAGLGLSGALVQTVLRNPLAEPAILGISGGASLAAVVAILFADRLGVPGGLLFAALPALAVLGGILAALLVYRLAWRGGTSPRRLVLCGIGIAGILQLVVGGLLAGWGQGRIETILIWVAGSLYGVGWREVGLLAATTVCAILALPFLIRPAALLALGDHRARGLGLGVETARVATIGTAVILASIATAIAGPIAFVGLVVPHMARRLAGGTPRTVLLISPPLGAALVTAADTIGRTAFVPYEMPVGVLSAVIGVPVFLHLLRRAP